MWHVTSNMNHVTCDTYHHLWLPSDTCYQWSLEYRSKMECCLWCCRNHCSNNKVSWVTTDKHLQWCNDTTPVTPQPLMTIFHALTFLLFTWKLTKAVRGSCAASCQSCVARFTGRAVDGVVCVTLPLALGTQHTVDTGLWITVIAIAVLAWTTCRCTHNPNY